MYKGMVTGMTRYVIGVDGGGTKSHLAIFDTNAKMIDFKKWGTLNHECMEGAFEKLEQEMEAFFLGALRENNIDIRQIEYSVFGIAGVDTKKQHEIISGILERIGFDKFTLSNDAYLGIPAGSADGTGICAINGTGCNVVGKDINGRIMQIGGVGPISGDLGGASNLGRAAISSIYNSLFRQGESTVMTDILFKSLGITNKYDFIETLMEKLEKNEFKISRFNRLLFEGASLGDKVACAALEAVAENYASAANYLLQELAFPEDKETHIVFAGSVFVKGEHPFLIDTVKKLINSKNPQRKLKYVLLEKPPVAGAVVEAINRIGCESIVNKVYGQF